MVPAETNILLLTLCALLYIYCNQLYIMLHHNMLTFPPKPRSTANAYEYQNPKYLILRLKAK